MSQMAAGLIANCLREKPNAVIVLPTGKTPEGMYQALIERYCSRLFDTKRLTLFQLDEYPGMSEQDERSCFYRLRHDVLEPLEIKQHQIVRLHGDASEPDEECRRYDQALQRAGGFDLAVLGLGMNGHLGLNEPPSDCCVPTRVVELSQATKASMTYWSHVPEQALTCGMAQLLQAKRIVLLVAGEHKRAILQKTMQGPVTPDVPASYLQRAGNVVVLADAAAWPLHIQQEAF